MKATISMVERRRGKGFDLILNLAPEDERRIRELLKRDPKNDLPVNLELEE